MIEPPRYQGTVITETPTLRGPAGQAWRLRLLPVGHRGRREEDATVDAFVVRVPGAHAFWDHWLVSLIHLRPIPGVKPADTRVLWATHELLIITLDPTEPLPFLDANEGSVHFLSPIDIQEQFTVENDAVAASLLELVVGALVEGQASPDQDWRRWWHQAMTTTARHFRDGTHPVPKPS